MLRRRLSAQFDVVHIRDEGLMLGLTDDQHRRYAVSRDVADIPAEVLAQCTVFGCLPLTTESEGLAANVGEPGVAWRIFAKHVRRAARFTDEAGVELLRWDATGNVEDRCRELVPLDVVLDVVACIIKRAGVDTAPFSPPLTLSGERMRYRVLHAAHAQTGSVSA